MDFIDQYRTAVIRIIGAVFLLVGVLAALVAPAEIYTFYLFEEGGPFYYDGVGFGSLMYANIAIQIAGYYVIALLGILLGYGHLKFRWWTKIIMNTLLLDWLIVGLPLSLIAIAILLTFKNITVAGLPFVVLTFLLLYPIVPIMLLKFYRNPSTQYRLKKPGSFTNWLSRTPQLILVISSLMVLLTILLHFPLMFNSFLPIFGHTIIGLAGTIVISLLIATSMVIALGIAQRKYWAWFSALLFIGLLILSLSITFLAITPQEIIAQMRFAPLEVEALSGIPMRGYYFIVFFGFIPGAIFVSVAMSHRHFISQE